MTSATAKDSKVPLRHRAASVSGTVVARGAAWMLTLKLADRAIGFASTLILARLLTPADFGLVALATSVVALIELMGAFGFDSALIQRSELERTHYDTAWTFNALFGVTCAAVVLALTYPAAWLYHEPRLHFILPVLALSGLIAGLENIGTVAFRKEMAFQREFRFVLAKRLATFTVTVGLALAYRSYWSLVCGILVGRIASVLLSYRLHPFRPRFTLAARADLLHFSQWLFLSNLVVFLQNKSADFILGRTIGTHGLGVYSIAAEVAVLPSTELIAPLNRAVFPAYSQLSGNEDRFHAMLSRVFSMVAIVAFPVSLGLLSVAEPAVLVLLGSQWREAVPILQLFAVAGLCGALQSNLFLALLALGKPKVHTLIYGSMLVVYLPALVFASLRHGALGAAWVHLAMSLAAFIPIQVIFLRITGMPARRYLAMLWRPIVGTTIMLIIIWGESIAPSIAALAPLSRLTVNVISGALAYAVSILALWRFAGMPEGPERQFLDVVTRAASRLCSRTL